MMMHCECGWVWSWENDPTPHCPFCESVGTATDESPPEAHAAVSQASGPVFEGSRDVWKAP